MFNIELENKDLKKLSNPQLLEETQTLVKEERKLGTAILHRLREISGRRLYAELGHSSLFSYCVNELKYPEASAFRLINAMKLLAEIPEIEEKIESGVLSVSTVSQVQTYCQSQNRENGLKLNLEEKKEILNSVEGKSKRETEKVLSSLHPENPLPEKREKERVLNPKETEIRFVVSEELMAKLKRIQDLLGHQLFNPSYAELFDQMAEMVLDRIDPIRKAQKKEEKALGKKEKIATQVQEKPTSAREQLSPGEVMKESEPESLAPSPTQRQVQPVAQPIKKPQRPREYISVQKREETWKKADSRCCFVSPLNGQRCTETRGLEIEHCHPWALGGSNSSSNFILLCKAHNLQNAIRAYGQAKMDPYLSEKS